MNYSRSSVQHRVVSIIRMLRGATKGMQEPASSLIIKRYGKDPYLILISCLLSLRTKDTISFPASVRLFEHAKTPHAMLRVPIEDLEKVIHDTGFYRNKAKTLRSVSKDLIDRFGGKVPKSKEELLSIKGIGIKTANLVLGEAFGIPALCVDTHVHKISNRLGIVKTKSPEETEKALQSIVPKKYWIEYGRLLVVWGQNICVPIRPFCSNCAIADVCPRIGVTSSR